MQTTVAKLRRTAEFARDAGVTARTLHLYDRLDLLKPAAVTESGYRLYGEAELERLEQILALRFVGFTLDQIKELLRGPRQPLVVALRLQREVIARQKRRLESALTAIDAAERALSSESGDTWETLRNVIEVFKMQNDWEWVKKYYSPEALEKIEENLRSASQELIEQGQRDWTTLLAAIEDAAAHGIDPNSEAAQKLAARWRELLQQFTRGSAEIQSGLNRLWSDPTHWPGDLKRPWSDAADEFIKNVMGRKGDGNR
jgi:DNA-binding transcriptional MerR regulator